MQNIPLVFHSVGSRRENLVSVLKTVLSWVHPCHLGSFTAAFGWLFLLSQLYTLLRSRGTDSCSSHYSVGARSPFCSQKFSGWWLWWAAEGWAYFPSMLVQCMWTGYWYLSCYAHTVSDTAVALSGSTFVPYINNDTFKLTSTPCRNWLLLVSTSCSSGVGKIYLYHLGPLGRRGETCREHATAVTSQGAIWLLGITAFLLSLTIQTWLLRAGS